MTCRHIATLVLAWSTLVLPAPAATRYMPIEEVQPGMTGVGRTVFHGTRVEEFKVQVLGVLRSNIGPRRDLILARLEGGPLAKTGVIAGMSGSPVYIDGRLVGAVAYAIGAFATEPIAGITPIGEMLQATFPGPGTAARPVPIALGADISALWRTFQDAAAGGRPFAAPASDLARLTSRADAGPLLPVLRPIAVPLTMGGFDASVAEPVLRAFEQAGFVAVPGGGAQLPPRAPDAGATGPLGPGDPVGVALISGDLQFGATGTITEVADGRVYAFGHPLYNLGPTRFPMTRAYVHAVLPSLASSMKLASIGDIVGTFQQDRATAIAGTLGPPPAGVRMTVSLRRDGGARRTFAFSIVDDPMLTPLLIYTALANIVSSHERDFGPSTYTVSGATSIAGHGRVAIDDAFAGDQPGIAAAQAIAMPLGALMTNEREPVRLEAINVDIESAERLRVATIDRIWFDATEIRRGQTVPLKIALRTWRGEPLVRTVAVEIPLNAEGELTVVVADGARLTQWEQRDPRSAAAADSVDQMIKIINDTRRGNRLYVRLSARDMGATINGEVLPALPSSVLAVLKGDRGGSASATRQTATLGAWDIPMGQAVSGMRTLTITLDPLHPLP